MRKHTDTMIIFAAFAIFCGSCAGFVHAFDKHMTRRALEREAFKCARMSVADFESPDAGTDAALAACYTSRGIAVPSDI